MRIPSNKIADIISFFRKELNGLYDAEELENIIWLSFHHVLGYSRSELQLNINSNVNQSDLLQLNFICKGLRKHKPLQYVLGETEFCGMTFRVNENVLIPRPETEELVYIMRDALKKRFPKNLKILDIGTGSGCIAISLKKFIPQAEVHALDVSDGALSVAKENASLNNADVHFHQADILNYKNINLTTSFDVIVSNPPYITLQEKSSLEKHVVDFEPHLALFADADDPLIFYRTIIAFADSIREKKISVYFEMNAEYAQDVKSLTESNGFSAEIVKDMFGKDRFLHAEK